MQVISLGFTIKSEVSSISSIKPGGSGKTPNGIEYGASVKVRSVNIIEQEFEDTFKEVEEIIEYKVPCQSSKEAVEVTNALRALRAKKIPVYINTSIPKKYDGDIYLATSVDNAKTFLTINSVKQADQK